MTLTSGTTNIKPMAGSDEMPKHAWPIWLLVIAVILGLPLCSLIYFTAEVETWSATERMNGDSLSIPIGMSIVVAFVAAPAILGLAYLCLRRYNEEATIWAWRSDRPIRSFAASTVFGVVALGYSAVSMIQAADAQRWFDFVWIAYLLAWAWLALLLRAAIVTQISRNDWFDFWSPGHR